MAETADPRPVLPTARRARARRLAIQGLHLVFSLACAALAPAVAASSLLGIVGGLIVFIIAGGHVALLGLPLAALGAWRNMISWRTATLGGFIVGALPSAVFFFPLGLGRLMPPAFSFDKMLPNGGSMLAAWGVYSALATFFGVFGAAGGVGFWFAWDWIRVKLPADRGSFFPPAARPEPPTGS